MNESAWERRVSRRKFLKLSTAAAAGAVTAAKTSSAWGSWAQINNTGKRVAVLGGGMAGLAAAHELVERGFEVVVIERKARRTEIIAGHLSYVDSPWALTSISQAQFWADRDLPARYGDGTVQDILSVDISNWTQPGILYGKPASRCTRQEIADEVWAQIKAHLEDTGRTYLPDDLPHSWFLDPAITHPLPDEAANDEPLLVNTVGSWFKRPTPDTAIPNLFLAGDYVRTNIDLATMEGANESARHAVNSLLEAAGSTAEPARTYSLYVPPEFEALKAADAELFRQNKPHALDTPWPVFVAEDALDEVGLPG